VSFILLSTHWCLNLFPMWAIQNIFNNNLPYSIPLVSSFIWNITATYMPLLNSSISNCLHTEPYTFQTEVKTDLVTCQALLPNICTVNSFLMPHCQSSHWVECWRDQLRKASSQAPHPPLLCCLERGYSSDSWCREIGPRLFTDRIAGDRMQSTQSCIVIYFIYLMFM
jgi:hypothetical protein